MRNYAARAVGSNALIEATIASLQRKGKDALREIFCDDDSDDPESWTRLGLRAWKTRLKNCERDATRQWLEIRRVIDGDTTRALLVWLASQGVESVELANNLLALAQRAVTSTERDAYTLAKQLVRARVLADPDERRRVRQEIFGEMSAPIADVVSDATAHGEYAHLPIAPIPMAPENVVRVHTLGKPRVDA